MISVCRIALLRLWKERNGPYATYQQLASCLHKVGKIDAVQALCEQLGAPASAMTPAPTHTSTQPPPQPQPGKRIYCSFIFILAL